MNILEVAEKLNLNKNDLFSYNDEYAKIINFKNNNTLKKLILVTSINPTSKGEGKTTLVIGLNDALRSLNINSLAVLREPSMGPVFGVKGGATGGGAASIIPSDTINLSFTGDIDAVTNANNLISALIDNHIFHGNELDIKNITFNRCLDVNDRSLRNIYYNDSEAHFDITAASEMMGIMTLAKDQDDLKNKIDNIIIGFNSKEEPVYFKSLNCTNAILKILKQAIYPNLVQSLEHNPVLVHMGPFANVSIGCNSLLSTNLALNLADYTIVEAGFGSDLGAEKFYDIKCRYGNLKPSMVLINITIDALKQHGNGNLIKGFDNLKIHINNMKLFNKNIIVVLNKYETNTLEEINELKNFVESENVLFEISESYLKGSLGVTSLAKTILNINGENNFNYLYDLNLDIISKINTISKKIYRAKDVIYNDDILSKIKKIEELGFKNLPICIAKTPLSLSSDKNILDVNQEYDVEVKDIKVKNGASYIVVYLGNILTMPGLPKEPNAMNF